MMLGTTQDDGGLMVWPLVIWDTRCFDDRKVKRDVPYTLDVTHQCGRPKYRDHFHLSLNDSRSEPLGEAKSTRGRYEGALGTIKGG